MALLFDAAGSELGFALGYVENVPANDSRSFQIDTSFAEIKPGEVAETRVFASAWHF